MGAMGRKAAAEGGTEGGLSALAGILGGRDGKFDFDDVRNIAGRFL